MKRCGQGAAPVAEEKVSMKSSGRSHAQHDPRKVGPSSMNQEDSLRKRECGPVVQTHEASSERGHKRIGERHEMQVDNLFQILRARVSKDAGRKGG